MGKRIFKTAIKVAAWTVMAAVLFVAGIAMGVVNILTPERLTPLTERIVTGSLVNAEVSIGRVELTVVSTFPFVHADIRDLVVLSTVSRDLDPETRDGLPAYADTVLTVDRFSGGLNVMRLFGYQLDLADVIIEHPSANLVIIDEETTNFDIIPPKKETEDKPFNWEEIPGISLRRFAIENPGKIRFYNNDTSTELSAAFTQVSLDGSRAPLYTLNFDGNIEAPSEFLDLFNIPDLRFGLNGSMHWSQEHPALLRLEDFDFGLSVFGGTVNTEVDFSHGVTFNSLDVTMVPLDIKRLLTMIPEDIAAEYGLPPADAIDTDASLLMAFRTDGVWRMSSDTIPPVRLTARIPSCRFRGYDAQTDGLSASLEVRTDRPWDIEKSPLPDLTVRLRVEPTALRWSRLQLRRFVADITARIPDGNPARTSFDIASLELQGPATDLSVKGRITNVLTDPTFKGTIDGKTDFGRWPTKILDALNGSLSGTLTTHIAVDGSQSMFSAERFHLLNIKGDVALDNLYWVAGDTINMVDINSAVLRFGTSETVKRKGEVKADSMLRVSLRVDSGLVLHDDLAMRFSKFRISLGAQNTAESINGSRRVNPMGGSLSLKTFNLLKTNDSTVVRLRDVKGYTVVKAYNGDIRTPQFVFDLDIGRVATGDRETRLLINNAHTRIDARRVAKGRAAKQFSRIADSVHYAHPHLSPDSVIALALEIHNRHRSRYPRVHERYVASDSLDVMDWGASPLFRRILSLWTIDGSLKSQRASLFTPHLPLRNRLRNIDVRFSNDSITINNLQYKIGRSDFTINGAVSNMRRAFTSPGGKQPLRVNFDMVSDTIDVNQITETLIAGAAYGATAPEKRRVDMAAIAEDEESLEEHIARLTENAPDTVMPILIPQNLDARFAMKANHVLYSDFELQKMSGTVLTYDGALNLQELSASSSVGSVRLSALYSGLHPDRLRFGFGLQLNDFNLHRFLKLVPAVDSMLPVMRDFSGIISARIAATSDVDRSMNLVLPTLDAAIGIEGDSLVLLDPDTFKSLSKWLLFKDKNRNIIDHLDVQMTVRDNRIEIYPFIFDFDRYKLGVQGYNDFDMNFDYHIAVLKSPIPFKFGINVSGHPDDIKVRLGGARFGEQQIRSMAIVDTTRVNLMREIQNVFRRGARDARLARLKVTKPLAADIDLATDSLTHADSLRYIKEGLIEAAPLTPHQQNPGRGRKDKGRSDVSGAEGAWLTAPVLAAAGRTRRRRRRRS